jgi:hypothetical protein
MNFRLQTAVIGSMVVIALFTPLQSASAANIYVTGSGNTVADDALVTMLQGFGHTVTLGVEYWEFDGSQSLAGFNTVYLQTNYNWPTGDMPDAGQTSLVNFVNGGGGLVTCEWIIWKTGVQNHFNILEPIFPVMETGNFVGLTPTTFTQTVIDPILNAGLPNSFEFQVESLGGTETVFTAIKPGATTYYNSSASSASGVVGWGVGAGNVLQFSTLNTTVQVEDPNFARLLSNSMGFISGNFSAAAPEPGTFALLFTGYLTIGWLRRRK